MDEYEEPQQPSFLDKTTRQMKKHPLIPLGMLATAGTLTVAFRRMQQRDAVGYQRWLRARVVAQGLTIVAIVFAGVQEMGMGVLTGNARPTAPPPTSAFESREFEKRLKQAEEAHRIDETVKSALAQNAAAKNKDDSNAAPSPPTPTPASPAPPAPSTPPSSWSSWLGWSKKG
ncbi:hypothetical protein M0805_004660 [Coniferiporia weirii]|nr:hypothetical protein M0805_004660 [Coniferiporia weirii]